MSIGAQVDLQWAASDAAQGGVAASPAIAPRTDEADAGYLTDEEILGIEPVGGNASARHSVILSEAKNLSSIDRAGEDATKRDSSGKDDPQNDSVHGINATAAMPPWMAAAAADPTNAGEAAALWREHQEFRAAFSSAEEARAVRELLPGGVKDVLTLREATQSVDRIDAALFSGDARAQSEVVAELARVNPGAFRAMFAEAARVMAGMGAGGRRQEAGGREGLSLDQSIVNGRDTGPTLRKGGEGWGTQGRDQDQTQNQNRNQNQNQNRRQDAGATNAAANHESQFTNRLSPFTSHQSPHFDPAAYAAFERTTNDVVARDVRGSISDTLARVMPEGVADGAARRIGEDIFNEVHRALAADRNLSEQVAGVLSDRRFDSAQQLRVAQLLVGRAKQLVPSVARRVIGEWTGTVLSTARSKAARQAAAASRVDIAAPGGSLDSMPLRQMSAREVNYASMSDEQILGI